MRPVLPIYRLVTLSLSLFFTLVLLGLSAHLFSASLASGGRGSSGNDDTDDTLDQFDIPHRRHLSKRLVGDGGSQNYEGLGIATSVLSLLVFSTLIGMGIFRKGSFISWNIVELPLLGFMTLLWIAQAGLSVQGSVDNYQDGCSLRGMNDASKVYCSELHGVQAVSFLTWLLLLAYIITNIVFFVRMGRGWKISVNEASYHSGPRGEVDGGFEKDRMQVAQIQQYAPVATYNQDGRVPV